MTDKIDHAARVKEIRDWLSEHDGVQEGSEVWRVITEAADYIRQLEALVRDMAPDIAERVAAEYPDNLCAKYPSYRRSRDLNMELVNKARALGLKE